MPDATGLELIAHELRERVPESVADTVHYRGAATLVVRPQRVLETLRWLRDEPSQRYNFLASLHGADYLPLEPRFAVHYELLNMERVERLNVKALLDDPGDPVTLINVRALMVPPGIPEFLTRTRLLEAGPVTLSGRAWAGRLDVTRVDVSTDGGAAWQEAELGEPVSRFSWRPWRFQWQATPGPHTLVVRATDSEGRSQPLAQPWNAHGMGNNMPQRVDVIVE